MYINLGCGSVFVDDNKWTNLDYNSSTKAVKESDLLKHLPFSEETAQLIYASHFFEHIPYAKVNGFLREIFRILKPGGVVRLVLPDLEEMASSYLTFRKKGDHEKANFLILEIIDQCVRNTNGGELVRFYQKIKNNKNKYKHMIDFIHERNGEELKTDYLQKRNINDFFSLKLTKIFSIFYHRIKRYWTRAVLLALPFTFRTQNVSLSGIGERHQWVWDFYTLKQRLEASGFTNVTKVSATTSAIKDFPFFPLDVDNQGRRRKGLESMYIEATKV